MNITVFCSSSDAVDQGFFKVARELGETIAPSPGHAHLWRNQYRPDGRAGSGL